MKEVLSDTYVANRDNLNWSQPTELIKIENNPTFEDLKAYPNPLVKGHSLNLKLNGIMKGDEILVSVFDIAGKAIAQEKLHGSSDGIYELKNTRSLQLGTYLLNIESKKKSVKILLEVK